MRKEFVSPLFRSLDESGSGSISKSAIVERLASAGIALSDARLARFAERLGKHDTENLDCPSFRKLLSGNSSIFERAIQGRLIIPEWDGFRTSIQEIFDAVVPNRDGKVADYIPQLARVPEDSFAVAVSTIDGQRMSIGDHDARFTLQSSCKPLLYWRMGLMICIPACTESMLMTCYQTEEC